MHSDHDYLENGTGYGGLGHNHHTRPAAQWQTAHRQADAPETPIEQDLDKVEAAFVEGFIDASDPPSFLRLAGVPFEIAAADGTKLRLLRVEIDAITDVGSVTPHLGGVTFRYDPLPAKLASHRRRLSFVYFDGSGLRQLTFAETRIAC